MAETFTRDEVEQIRETWRRHRNTPEMLGAGVSREVAECVVAELMGALGPDGMFHLPKAQDVADDCGLVVASVRVGIRRMRSMGILPARGENRIAA